MNISVELQKEIGKIEMADGLTLDNLRLNSDLGKMVISNLVKRLLEEKEEDWKLKMKNLLLGLEVQKLDEFMVIADADDCLNFGKEYARAVKKMAERIKGLENIA